MQYLAHVLGWKSAESTPSVAELPLEKVPVDEQQKVHSMLNNDYTMYSLIQRRVAAQAAFLSALQA